MAKRKRSNLELVRDISRQILQHPANRQNRLRALTRGWGWQVRKRLRPRPVDVDYEGYVLRCYPDSQSVSNVWYFTARYDVDEMDFLDRYLRQGDHVLDIGANIGTYTLFSARRIGSAGRVVAFEPEPRNAARLRENVARNELGAVVEVHEEAVAHEVGEVELLLDHDVSNAIVMGDGLHGAHRTVASVRIDGVVPTGPRLAVAKLDVEGAEAMALRGATLLLAAATPPVWIVEVFDHQLRRLGSTVDELLALFSEHGFAPYQWSASAGRLGPAGAALWGNVVFVSTAHLGDVEARLDASSAVTGIVPKVDPEP